MADKFSFLAVNCLLLIAANAEWLNCTPPGQSAIVCSVSNNTDDCIGTDNIMSDADALLPNAVNFTAEVFRPLKSGPLGVKLSWKSPNSDVLSKTEGYVLRIIPRDSLQSQQELCRYFKVNKTQEYVSVADANLVTFTYEVESLEKEDVTYQAELYTLPYSPREHGVATYVSFRTFSTITAAPLVYDKELMDLQINNSKPYALSGRFRMASHFPTLKDVYTHVAYRVLLINPSASAVVKGISGNFVDDRIVATEEEYANFTLEGLLPGEYPLQVRPLVDKCDEFIGCAEEVDFDHIDQENVAVTGVDYQPSRRPVLFVSTSNDVEVDFSIAPSYYYIDDYVITLRKEGKPSGHLFTPQATPLPSSNDGWQRHKININASQVLKHFRAGEVIVAEVTPKLNPAICKEPGYCNLNGTCTPCSRSISLDQTLYGPDVATPQTAENYIWVTGVVIPVVILIIIGLLIFYRKMLPAFTKCLKGPQPPVSYQPTTDDMASVIDIIPNKVSICLAYAQHEQYKEFYESFRSVLEHHFNCSVSMYSGSPETRDLPAKSDFNIVLYSWPLVETYFFLKSQPQTIPSAQKHRQAVLDLLLTPEGNPASSPVHLVIFDTVPCRNINQILDGNSDINLFKLPTEFKQLIRSLHGVTAETQHNQYWWQCYEEGAMKIKLNETIASVTRYDSGFDSLSIATVQTGAVPYVNVDNQHEGYGPERLNTGLTTTARAPEQRYLRQESVDYTTHNGQPPPAVYGENSRPALAQHTPYQVLNRANGMEGIDSAQPGASASEYQRLSNECESVASSRVGDDSIEFSDFRPSMLASDIEMQTLPSSTIDC